MSSQTKQLHAATEELIQGLRPEPLSAEHDSEILRDLQLMENSARAARLFAVLRVGQTGVWKGQGHASVSHWMAALCEISVEEASEQLHIAEAANEFPRIKEAMLGGELSIDEAEVMIRGATALSVKDWPGGGDAGADRMGTP